MGHLFYKFLPFGTPGFRVNCFSCLCGAGATLALFVFCQRWYASRGYRASSGWALLVAGSWALSPLLWQYHVQAEVFSLNNLIVAVQFLLAQLHHEACAPPDRSKSGEDDHEQRKRRARMMARLGALAVGLGFSNQHAIVFYSFPIVIAVLCTDMTSHGNVNEASFFLQLVGCGLFGLTPYLEMPWSASRGVLAQLGSWGDQRSLSGLMTHFLRQEYGTFRLYSGSDMAYVSIFKWAQLYAANLSENFMVVGPVLVLAGLLAVLMSARQERMGGLVAGSLLFYWIIFHNLANLPANDALMLGVHMRFWMQAHVLAAGALASLLIAAGALASLFIAAGALASLFWMQAHVLAAGALAPLFISPVSRL
jgi:hypothetical protein